MRSLAISLKPNNNILHASIGKINLRLLHDSVEIAYRLISRNSRNWTLNSYECKLLELEAFIPAVTSAS
jgi:hypothetical protein